MSIFDDMREAIFAIHADDALFITLGADYNDRAALDPLGADYIPEARVTAAIDALEGELPTPCGDCRHWGGYPDSGRLGSCHVTGSFCAPGGLLTEADFGCIHGTKP